MVFGRIVSKLEVETIRQQWITRNSYDFVLSSNSPSNPKNETHKVLRFGMNCMFQNRTGFVPRFFGWFQFPTDDFGIKIDDCSPNVKLYEKRVS